MSETTTCGMDGHGVCPSLGVPAGVSPPATVVGLSTEVDLAHFFNSDAVTTPSGGLRLGGVGGEAFAEATFPSSGNLTLHVGGHVVTFLIPAFGPGVASALRLARGVTIPLPRNRYATLWLLGAGDRGTFGPLAATLTYVDGSRATLPLTFRDWCNDGLPLRDAPPALVAVAVPYVLGPSGAAGESATAAGSGPGAAGSASLSAIGAQCGLWAEGVALPPAHPDLADLSLPPTPAGTPGGAYLVGLTLTVSAPAAA